MTVTKTAQGGVGFPRHLLAASAQERKHYFENYVVEHRLMRQAIADFLHHVHWSPRNSLVHFIGPTGAGKTTVRQRIHELLLAEALHDMERDPGLIAVVSVPAIASHRHIFGWDDFLTRCLIALDEPLIDRKVVRRIAGTSGAKRLTIPEKQRILEGAYRYRHTRACLIDEAQHATKLASGSTLLDQLDVFKSMADEGGVMHGMFGTYDLLDWRKLNGQLRRRSPIVELRRYRRDDAADVQAFYNTLAALQKHLPLEQEPDIMRHFEFCMQRSIGCVGILKDWLLSALGAALDRGDRTMTAGDLKAYAPSVDDAVGWIEEAMKGEKKMAERNSPAQEAKLSRLLGMGGVPAPQDEGAGEDEGEGEGHTGVAPSRAKAAETPGSTRRSGGGRKGVRKPKRDIVGVGSTEDPDAA